MLPRYRSQKRCPSSHWRLRTGLHSPGRIPKTGSETWPSALCFFLRPACAEPCDDLGSQVGSDRRHFSSEHSVYVQQRQFSTSMLYIGFLSCAANSSRKGREAVLVCGDEWGSAKSRTRRCALGTGPFEFCAPSSRPLRPLRSRLLRLLRRFAPAGSCTKRRLLKRCDECVDRCGSVHRSVYVSGRAQGRTW